MQVLHIKSVFLTLQSFTLLVNLYMNNYPLVTTLGSGSLLAFFLFFIFYKVLHWSGKMAALATAACMLLVYVPLSITHWAGIDVFAIHFAFFMMIPYGLGIITGVHAERRQLEGEASVKKGLHWIPAFIVVFFILIAVVDSVIISFATTGLGGGLARLILPEPRGEDVSKNVSSQFTGAVSNNLQDEEKQFDEYVVKLNEQRKRGWKITGGWDKTPQVNQEGIFRLKPKDEKGKLITKAKVTIDFRRASNMKRDQSLEFKETQTGVYSAPVTLPLAGCWDMKVLVVKNNEEYEIKGQTEVATMIDGKLVRPECTDGEPDID